MSAFLNAKICHWNFASHQSLKRGYLQVATDKSNLSALFHPHTAAMNNEPLLSMSFVRALSFAHNTSRSHGPMRSRSAVRECCPHCRTSMTLELNWEDWLRGKVFAKNWVGFLHIYRSSSTVLDCRLKKRHLKSSGCLIKLAAQPQAGMASGVAEVRRSLARDAACRRKDHHSGVVCPSCYERRGSIK